MNSAVSVFEHSCCLPDDAAPPYGGSPIRSRKTPPDAQHHRNGNVARWRQLFRSRGARLEKRAPSAEDESDAEHERSARRRCRVWWRTRAPPHAKQGRLEQRRRRRNDPQRRRQQSDFGPSVHNGRAAGRPCMVGAVAVRRRADRQRRVDRYAGRRRQYMATVVPVLSGMIEMARTLGGLRLGMLDRRAQRHADRCAHRKPGEYTQRQHADRPLPDDVHWSSICRALSCQGVTRRSPQAYSPAHRRLPVGKTRPYLPVHVCKSRAAAAVVEGASCPPLSPQSTTSRRASKLHR